MEFCKKCNNILDISRSAPKQIIVGEETPTTISDSTGNNQNSKIVNKFLSGKNIDYEDIKFVTLDGLQKSEPFLLKLTSKERDSLTKIIKELEGDTDDATSAFKICKNCYYYEQITKTTLIISRMNNSTTSGFLDSSKYSFMKHDKSLPHTREYTCVNKNCQTHKNPGKKSAVWFRPELDSFVTYYVCEECGENWNIALN